MPSVPRLLSALITPFTRTGEIDVDAHRYNLRLLTKRGIRGFLIGGSTGEGPYLENGERARLVQTARRELAGRTFLLAGVAAESVRTAIGQIEEVAEAGADAALVLTPTTLVRNNHAAVEGFFGEVADGSPLPVFLYSVPAVTGYALPVETAAGLSRHPTIAGMKDSGGDPVAMTRLADETPDEFVLMTGSSKAVTLCMTAGAYGAITASSNYLPELVLDLVKTARRSARTAAPSQARLTLVSAAVEAYRVPGVKAAAQLAGLRAGHPRKPLLPLPAGTRRKIERVLDDAGVR